MADEKEIPLDASPLPHALDMYYSSLRALCAASGFNPETDRLVLNNTITSFDIAQATPYYNEGLFRRFADRVYTVGAEELSPVSQADRFSTIYDNLMRTVAVQIDQRHPEIVDKIEELRRHLKKDTDDLTAKIKEIEASWAELAKTRGLDRDTDESDYILQQVTYFEQVKYSDQIKDYSNRITDWIFRIEQARRAVYTPSQTLFLNTLAEMTESKKIARPLRPTFETSTPGANNDLFYADRTKNPESLCDISFQIYPLGDLVKFLKEEGVREPIDINQTTVAKHQHHESWNASAKASFPLFGIGVGLGGGADGSSQFLNNVKTTNGIKIGFENIAEVLVDRGYWFNPGLFDDPDLGPLLYAHPGMTDRLRFAASSLIICRGLTLSLTFTEDASAETWTKQNVKAKGGVSFMGFKFGGSGGKSVDDYTLNTSEDKRTITFKDDSQLCRLLAVRLVDFADPPKADEVQPASALVSRFVSNRALNRMANAQISYRDVFSR